MTLQLTWVPGPTWFSREPVLLVDVPAASLVPEGCSEAAVRAAAERLRAAFPGWLDGLPPLDFLAPAHALALLAMTWAQGLCNAERGLIDEAGAMPLPKSRCRLWLGVHVPAIGAAAMTLGLAHAQRALGDALAQQACADALAQPARGGTLPDDPALAERRRELLQQCRTGHPSYVTRVLLLAARARALPARPALFVEPKQRARSTWQFGWGARSRVFFEASPVDASALAITTARHKLIGTERLGGAGLPVPRERSVENFGQALAAARELGWPVVLKPSDLGLGRGVVTGIRDEATLRRAFDAARPLSTQPLLVQAQVEGDDHRLLVVRGRLVAAARREPPGVTGDGRRSIEALVAALNAGRARQPASARYLRRVQRDAVIDEYLSRQGLDWSSVPAAGRHVRLRGNANVSTGGVAFDVTARVHPQVRQMVEQAAALVGLEVVGVDYLARGVDRPPADSGGVLLEVNHTPGLDLHLSDARRDEAELAGAILGDTAGVIPVVVVIDNDAAARQALAAALRRGLAEGGAEVALAGLGLVDDEGATLDGLPLVLADLTHAERAARLLAHPACQRLVVLLDCAAIARGAFPVPCSHLTLWHHGNHGGGLVPVWDTARCWSEELVQSGEGAESAAAERWLTPAITARLTAVLGAAAPPPPRLPRWRPADAGLCALNPRGPDGRLRDRGGLALCATMRNEARLLPHFLAHYRALGVASFHILDDGSDDGTREALLAEPDCTVWTTPLGFRQLLANGLLLLHHVRNEIPARAAQALGDAKGRRWTLVVDADEFLFVPRPFDGLVGPQGLIAQMERCGEVQALAAMVDLYPRRLADLAAAARDASPFEVAPWFDRDAGFTRDAGHRPAKQPGGVRWRLQRRLRERDPARHAAIYQDQGYTGPALWKSALVKTGSGVYFRDAHGTTAASPVGLQLALAHAKFGPDLAQRVAHGLQRKTHYLGGIEHRLLAAALELLADDELVNDRSVHFEGPASLAAALETAGLMFARAPFLGAA